MVYQICERLVNARSISTYFNVIRKLNLFLRKSIKLLPQELLLLAQICTKSFVGWGFAPDPTGGDYSAPPDPLTALRGPTSKGRGGEGREEGREGGGEGRGEGEGRGRKGRGREKGSRREGIVVEKNPYFKACPGRPLAEKF